jgi:uncharacterized membrane protein
MWKVGRDNWRSFVFAWSLPILLYLFLAALSLHGPTRSPDLVWFDLGALCLLVLAGVVGIAPYRRRKVPMGQTLFWILLVPVVIFLLLALLPFRLPITITEIPTGPNARWMKP